MPHSPSNHKPPSRFARWLSSRNAEPLKITLIYALVAGIWIVTSDTAIYWIAPDDETAKFLSVIKGWGFVITTAAMLWLLLRRLLKHIDRSEADLRESERQTRAIFNGVNDAIFIIDPHNVEILDVNETACRMFGHARDAFHDMSIEDLSSGAETFTEKHAREVIAMAMSEGQATTEWRARHRDGRLFWTEVSARPAVVGRDLKLLVTVRDIDARKQATEEVRKLSRAVEQSPVSIIITDPKGEIEYANPATCRLTGYSAAELIGQNPRFLKSEYTPPAEHHRLLEIILQGGEWRGEFKNRKKNGELYWEAVSISPITNDTGQTTHSLAVKEDITERKLIEQELHESRARLRALLARLQDTREEERTRISREVHDVLGQLLTGMKMDLSWCERRLARVADLDLRHELADKLAATTKLTDSMLESVQKISRDLRPSLLDNLGLAAALQFEARQFAERTGIACEIVSLASPVNLPPESATQVFRIFQEILTNVARHSFATRVEVSLTHPPGQLELSVVDNGCGIAADALHDPSSLGLLGMTERAALVGGTIQIHGSPDTGTTVNLTIPTTHVRNSTE